MATGKTLPDVGIREVDLEAGPVSTMIAGQRVELLAYNGQFPGPMLRLHEGERIRLRLTNRLGEPTNLHLHGLPIPPSVDDPRVLVEDGDAKVYEFDVLEGSAGTYWYHPHGHGSVGPQLFAGLAGPLIVEGAQDSQKWPGAIEDLTLLLKDIAISDGKPARHAKDDWLNGKEGDLVLVNGEVAPRIDITAGVARLRIINASNARYYRLQLGGHSFDYLGAGIGFAESSTTVESLLLAPGERGDVLVRFNGLGEFPLVALPYDRGADMSGMEMERDESALTEGHHAPSPGHAVVVRVTDNMHGHQGAAVPGGMAADGEDELRLGNHDPIVLATLISHTAAERFEFPVRLSAGEVSDSNQATLRRSLVLSEDMREGRMRFLINGKEYDPSRLEFQIRSSSTEIWEVINEADMDHPFHLHVFPFQLISRNGVTERESMWRDTVNLSPGDRLEILIPFTDFTGTVMYHCHIVEHEDLGMMGLFEVL